ncbi:hypothetical protein CDAR_308401 [Caerostris darwini]|uniref:Uncharacterized protein n=1 Tax=Caerostris darwini TaxID=1538125 RepID=A0AAV4TVY4_9ARAC|nr:hypothetical protein CDAR_308401 [Caerostris darwini]
MLVGKSETSKPYLLFSQYSTSFKVEVISFHNYFLRSLPNNTSQRYWSIAMEIIYLCMRIIMKVLQSDDSIPVFQIKLKNILTVSSTLGPRNAEQKPSQQHGPKKAFYLQL